jgi:ABC-type nitrate/sulfonate/bicarbonate transport system substrate-binding protein
LPLCAISLIGLLATSCFGKSGAVQKEDVRIAAPPLELNALLYVADIQGFYSRNGLNVTITDYDTGVACMKAMTNSEVDIALTAELPLVSAAFNRSPVSIITSDNRFLNDYIIARKDRGIQNIADLKGKRVGASRGTVVDFFFGRFLELNGLNLKDVTLVDMQSGQFLTAIKNGDIDALAAWQPFIYQAMQQGNGGLNIWSIDNNQPAYGLLVCRNDWIAQHSSTIKQVLRSLADAEDFMAQHPDQARSIVQNRLKHDSAYVSNIWPQNMFSLTLDFSLIAAMSDEARWMISNNLTTEKSVPDFSSYIYTDGLKAVKPDSVNIKP